MMYYILFYLLINTLSIHADSSSAPKAEIVTDDEFERYIMEDATLDNEPEGLRAKSWPGAYYVKKAGSNIFVKLIGWHKVLSDWWHERDED